MLVLDSSDLVSSKRLQYSLLDLKNWLSKLNYYPKPFTAKNIKTINTWRNRFPSIEAGQGEKYYYTDPANDFQKMMWIQLRFITHSNTQRILNRFKTKRGHLYWCSEEQCNEKRRCYKNKRKNFSQTIWDLCR